MLYHMCARIMWRRGTKAAFGLAIFAATAAAQTPPVILISVDTLRADHVSAYGYHRIQTPNIDSFASGGTLFAHADAQVPLTLPSHTSFFTSTYPFENGIEENAERVQPGATTLAGVLKANHFQTAAFVSSVFLERETGLDQGFDFYDSPFHFEAFSPLSGSIFFGGVSRNAFAARDRRDAVLTVGAALRWLRAHQKQPAFVFVHLYDLHRPYTRGSYDKELLHIDDALGTFRKALISEGWWDRSLIILLSDHGEGLGDHGEGSHGYFTYQSTLAVPLIFHWPSGSAYPARIEQPVGLLDVAPTILEFLYLPIPPSFRGRSLLDASSRGIYAETMHTHDSFGWAPLRSLREGDYKYIDAPKPELYNLRDDPGEVKNLVAAKPVEAEKLRAELRGLLALKRPQTTTQTPHSSAPLSALGYLAPGPGARHAGSNADPKDRLAEFQLYDQAMTDLFERRVDSAIAKLRKLLLNDPQNTLARRDLANSYLEKHQYAEARRHLIQVAAAAPDDYMTQFELGVASEHLGMLSEAREHLQVACRLAPEAAQCKEELAHLPQK